MKNAFMASFFHEGVLGGAIYLQSDKILYRTNKSQLERKYRNLEMPYAKIESVKNWVGTMFSNRHTAYERWYFPQVHYI